MIFLHRLPRRQELAVGLRLRPTDEVGGYGYKLKCSTWAVMKRIEVSDRIFCVVANLNDSALALSSTDDEK
jgi:hypothetical protein